MTTRREWLALAGLACAPKVWAENDRSPIRLLVGLAPGSGNDFTARLVADGMKELLGRPVNVENKTGVGQRLALGELRRAAPDGRTLALATTGPFVIYPHIYSRLGYDPFKDFTPIAGVASFDVAIAAGPRTNAKSVRELMALAAADPALAAFGSPGNGSLSHFVGIALGLTSKVELTHVPYKDSGPLVVDLVSGRLPFVITGQSNLMEPHRQGRVRILAVSGEQRSSVLPEVPTLREAGIALSSATTVGIFGPAGMAPELVRSLQAAILPAVAGAEAREKLARHVFSPAPSSAESLVAEIAAEHRRFASLVKASGYLPE